ncbi:Transcription factor GTE7 [Platanthera guangdongensis]|uniref:Transcription factor GTE7 n=1 Tax=Platanthera guangdongensis TaxID=2320717 RepID=A0ABR2MFD9_9ASPA
MASALLASRNEPYWGERKVYMKKNPNSNPNPRLGPHHNANPNPNRILHPIARGGYDTNHRDQKEDAPPLSGPVLSQDSSSFNWNSASLDRRRDAEVPALHPASSLRELKRRLVSELEQVRSITSRIESRELQSSARSVGYSASGTYCSSREVTSPAALQQKPLPQPDPFCEREIRVSDVKLLSQLPVSHNRDQLFGQSVPSSPSALLASKNLLTGMMKKCAQILGRLMRHKGSTWFNRPVDVLGMGLHDYPLIIKHPMDLGTVKSRLSNGFYSTPLKFAEDIRLTFNNALIYNPETHEVYKFAGQCLRLFEGLFGPAYAKYEKQLVAIALQEEKKICSSWSKQALHNPPPVPVPVPTPVHQHPSNPTPVELPSFPPPHQQKQAAPQQHPIISRTIGMKLPKPKARDPNKRPMSYEERQKLRLGIQSLPEEKMIQVLQIVRKRNVETEQDGDEIVIDFETMDIETLWELDRFVCNCKKMLSKIKRQEAMAGSILPAPATSAVAASFPPDEAASFHPDEGHKVMH